MDSPLDPRPFDPRTIACRADPDTSRQAAEQITASGGQLSQCDRIVIYLANHPGATVYEIGQAIGLNYLKVAKRMGDIADRGFEPRGECYVESTDSHMQMWWPAESAAAKQTSLF